MHAARKQFDVAIIGSGIAGSTLGAILARQDLQVVIFEAKSHPRFSIGESMILETSETMRALAELYDIPELAYFSSENYFPYIGTNHGVKRHFSYLHHTPGNVHDPRHSLQAVIPKHPHGHELHLYRQDVDYFLMTCAIRYGATVLQNTPVAEIEIDEEGVTLTAVTSSDTARPILSTPVDFARSWPTNSTCAISICEPNLVQSSRTWSTCRTFTTWQPPRSRPICLSAWPKGRYITSLKAAGCGSFPSTTTQRRPTRSVA